MHGAICRAYMWAGKMATSQVVGTRLTLFRFVNGVGVGACSMLTPLYISENVPRAIRGLLTGLYQLFIVTGGMASFPFLNKFVSFEWSL